MELEDDDISKQQDSQQDEENKELEIDMTAYPQISNIDPFQPGYVPTMDEIIPQYTQFVQPEDFFLQDQEPQTANFLQFDNENLVDDLKNRDLQNGLPLWQEQLGSHYYSYLQGQYQQPLDPNAIGPLLTKVFLPGQQHDTQGPRTQFEVPNILFQPEEPYNFNQQFALPASTLTGFNPDIYEGNPILDQGLIKLLRIKLLPQQNINQFNFHDVAQNYSQRLNQILGNMLQDPRLNGYHLLRLFFHISINADAANNPNDYPIQLNFQTIINSEDINEPVRIQIQAAKYLQRQISIDLLTNYYYEEIQNLRVNYVKVFALFEREGEPSELISLANQRFEKYPAFHSTTPDKTWRDLDLTKIFEEWRGLSCLEKILLFSFKTCKRKLTPFLLLNTEKELCEAAKLGKVHEIYVFLKDLYLKALNINLYLYLEGHNVWYSEQKPSLTEKCFIIVLRKSHAIIVENLKFQAALKEQRGQFVLNKPRVKSQQIRKYVFDIETYTNEQKQQIPYLICVIQENATRKYFWGDKCVKDFVKFVRELHSKFIDQKIEFWSFNGNKFDNLLIISEMLTTTKNVNILGNNTQIKIIKFIDIFFFDLILMYPGSLQNVAKQLGCETFQKLPLEVGGKSRIWYEENKQKIIEYCFQDCEITMQIVKKHYEYKKTWGLQNVQVGTNSSLSLKIYQNKFFKRSFKLKGAKTLQQYYRERESYHGGFTQNVYRGSNLRKFPKKYYYYDLNSSYPNVMQYQMPTEYLISKNYQGEPLCDIYMYRVEGEWQEDVLLPIYCEPKSGDRDLDGTLLYFRKFSRQYRWGVELKYMVENNLFKRLKISKVYQYTSQTPFKNFVTELYNLRLQYKKEGKEDLSQSVKLTLNSLYGKMGQRQFPELVWCNLTDLQQYIDRDDLATLEEIDENNNIYRLQFEQKETLDFLGSMVRYASYITAAARMNLFRMFHLLGFENILYSDTDSLISKIPMPKAFIDNTKLGAWKLEHEIQGITIWGPKFYKLVTTNQQTLEHIKGVKKENYSEELWNKLEKDGKVEIINKNVFTKRFGAVWVDDQKKLISIKTPNRNFSSLRRNWCHSKPFFDLEDFKKYHALYCDEELIIE